MGDKELKNSKTKIIKSFRAKDTILKMIEP